MENIPSTTETDRKRKAEALDDETAREHNTSTRKRTSKYRSVGDGNDDYPHNHPGIFFSDDNEDDDDEDLSESDDASKEGFDELSDAFEDNAFIDDSYENSESEAREYDIEEYQHIINSDPPRSIDFKSFVTREEEVQDWMQTIEVTCSFEGKIIGYTLGRHIIRDLIRSNFRTAMNDPSHEMAKLAFDIFDRYGCLKTQLREHPILKGTGVWGKELDYGSILFIEVVRVEKDWRRKGLGTLLTKAAMQKATTRLGGMDFALLFPSFLTRDLEMEVEGKSERESRLICNAICDASESFYRNLGFRRIGASDCFGLATDPEHGANQLAPADDFNLQKDDDLAENENEKEEDDIGKSQSFSNQKQEQNKQEVTQRQLPIHNAINTMLDADCVKFFETTMEESSTSTGEWKATDSAHNNILHIAACRQKFKTIQWIMENVNKDETLSLARNVKGYTPIEALQFQLEDIRIKKEFGMRTLCVSDSFSGYDPNSVACLCALNRDNNPTPDKILKYKFGCTCEKCLDGFLSPRMKFCLFTHAKSLHKALQDEDENAEIWCALHEHLITFVAADIRENFRTNKSLRRGFANLFDHIATCLHDGYVPFIGNVIETWKDRNEWPPVTMSFLQRGGKVESALKTIFDTAMSEDEKAGDGEFYKAFQDKIEELVCCRNDHEFGFVAHCCGLEQLDQEE